MLRSKTSRQSTHKRVGCSPPGSSSVCSYPTGRDVVLEARGAAFNSTPSVRFRRAAQQGTPPSQRESAGPGATLALPLPFLRCRPDLALLYRWFSMQGEDERPAPRHP